VKRIDSAALLPITHSVVGLIEKKTEGMAV